MTDREMDRLEALLTKAIREGRVTLADTAKDSDGATLEPLGSLCRNGTIIQINTVAFHVRVAEGK